MGTVAEQVGAWIENAGEAWPFGGAAVIWALPFDDDFERAWRECPRADYLVLLAAIGGAEVTTLQRVFCAITRNLLPLCPEQADTLHKMQKVTESFTRRKPLPRKLELGRQRSRSATPR